MGIDEDIIQCYLYDHTMKKIMKSKIKGRIANKMQPDNMHYLHKNKDKRCSMLNPVLIQNCMFER